MTLEHGHADHLADDWSSTAYWYQTLPSPVKSIPPVDEGLPPALRRGASTNQAADGDLALFR